MLIIIYYKNAKPEVFSLDLPGAYQCVDFFYYNYFIFFYLYHDTVFLFDFPKRCFSKKKEKKSLIIVISEGENSRCWWFGM